MKERPILFSGEMVRAILEGRKTQTRRVCKPQPIFESGYDTPHENEVGVDIGKNEMVSLEEYFARCPYGKPSDRLWVRETSCTVKGNGIQIRYKADGPPMQSFYPDEEILGVKWTPSIHMPRWASRINLEITNIRVERVQDTSESDIKSEGIDPMGCNDALRKSWQILWNSINEKRGFGWDKNPWVWVIEFRRLEE